MRAFIASLAVFAVVLSAAVLHALCIANVTDRLDGMEASFPKKEKEQNSPDPALQQAEEYWSNMRRRLSATVNMRYLNAVTNALRNVIDYYEEGTVSDYEAARSLFREAVEALRISDTIEFASLI
jgi:hypothetical protein